LAFAGNRFRGLLAGLFVLTIGCLTGSSAWALSPPPPPEKAQIFYSNGGRILSMNADGTNRRFVTGAGNLNRHEYGDELGDTQPQVSPDGKRLLFTRVVQTRKRGQVGRYMVASLDGGGAKPVRGAFGWKIRYRDPSWSPDGEELIFARSEMVGRYDKSSIVAVRPEGGERTIAKLKPTRRGENNVPRIFLNPKISPDGDSLLVEISDVLSEIRPRLEVIDLATGKRRVLARKASEGAWSPDGRRVVMAVDDGGKRPKFCLFGCFDRPSDIAIINADGTDRRILFGSIGKEGGPTWSADGSRIAFHSNRNFPAGEFSQEIYTITPEGACLTWLTNGTPESRNPAWSPSPTGSTDPGECGDGGRAVTAELSPVRRGKRPRGTQVWVGPRMGSMLYSFGDSYGVAADLEYGDCALYDSRKCGKEFTVSSVTKCLFDVDALDFFSWRGKYAPRSWNGNPYWRYRFGGRFQVDISMAGGSVIYVRTSDPATTSAGRRLLSNLKFIGTDRPVRLSKRVSLPAVAIKRLRKVTRSFERTGSVRATAAELDLSRTAVRDTLRADRRLERFGSPKTMRCPAGRGPIVMSGTDSGSGTDSPRTLGPVGPLG